MAAVISLVNSNAEILVGLKAKNLSNNASILGNMSSRPIKPAE